MTTPSSNADHDKQFPIVGRDHRVDLTKYTVKIHGRDVIDYEKLRADNPTLHKEIVADELETDRKHQEELDELSTPATELTPELHKSLQSVVVPEKPATSKYFYLPVFVSNPSQAQAGERYETDVLIFSDDSGQPMNYASRVLPGQTLADAVKHDLGTDFAHDGAFKIKTHHFYDMAPDKKGNPLPRLVVLIEVDRFSTADFNPAGLQAQWSPDAAKRLSAYGFEI